MAYDTEDDWEVVASADRTRARLDRELRDRACRDGVAKSLVAARAPGARLRGPGRDVGRRTDATRAPFFLARGHASHRRPDAARPAQNAAGAATDAYAELAAFLRDDYAPNADPRDPVGRDRYSLFARAFDGMRARPRRDVRVGLGGALPHRGAHARRRGAHRARRVGRRGRRPPRPRRDRTIEGVDAFQRVEPGPDRPTPSPSSTAPTSTSRSRCDGARR